MDAVRLEVWVGGANAASVSRHIPNHLPMVLRSYCAPPLGVTAAAAVAAPSMRAGAPPGPAGTHRRWRGCWGSGPWRRRRRRRRSPACQNEPSRSWAPPPRAPLPGRRGGGAAAARSGEWIGALGGGRNGGVGGHGGPCEGGSAVVPGRRERAGGGGGHRLGQAGKGALVWRVVGWGRRPKRGGGTMRPRPRLRPRPHPSRRGGGP